MQHIQALLQFRKQEKKSFGLSYSTPHHLQIQRAVKKVAIYGKTSSLTSQSLE